MKRSPVVPELRHELLRAAAEQLDAGAAPTPARRRFLRRRLRRGGAPLVVLLLAGTASIATSAGLVVSKATKDRAAQLTHEPVPGPGEASTIGEQMAATAREIQAELPYPPGMPDTYDWTRYPAGATLGSGAETRREIQLMSEVRAQCLWLRYYVRAYDAGNTQGMTDAAEILALAPSWPASRRLHRGGQTDPFERAAGLAARRKLPASLRDQILINCTDRVDPRVRPGETQADALARVEREAAGGTGRR